MNKSTFIHQLYRVSIYPPMVWVQGDICINIFYGVVCERLVGTEIENKSQNNTVNFPKAFLKAEVPS